MEDEATGLKSYQDLLADKEVMRREIQELKTELEQARATWADEVKILAEQIEGLKTLVDHQKLDKELIEFTQLRERCAKLESVVSEAKGYVYWFSKYPEFKPNPDMLDEFEASRKQYHDALAALDKE